MIAMSVSLLFIWWQGNIEEVGIFSGITAVVTPIIAFSQYRYVEYLSKNKNKHLALSTIISSSSVTFILVVSIVASIYIYIYGNFITVVLMCLYKYFEMLTDIYIAYLSIKKNNHMIKRMVVTRLSIIIVGFLFLLFLNIWYSINIIFSISLLLCLVFAILFILDFSKAVFKFNSKDNLYYIKNNIGYAFSSLTISLNSLLPRYLFIYTEDDKTLGIYSIIYLFSANLVTLVQYPISIYASYFNNFASKNQLPILLVSLLVALVVSPSLYFFDDYDYYFYIVSMILIFISLLLRAVLITSIVFIELNLKVLKILMMSLAVSFTVIIVINSNRTNSFKLEDGIYYTIISGCIAVLLSYYYRLNHKN